VAEEFDSVAKELDSVLVQLNFTTTELVSADAMLIRRSPRQLQSEVYLDRITNSIP
jgi:hypothetical protein